MYHTINIVFLKQYALSIESGAGWLIVGSWVRGASWPGRVAWVRVDLLPDWHAMARQSNHTSPRQLMTEARITTVYAYRHAEIHRTSDIDEETSQCPVNVVKTPDKMSYVFNVQPLKLWEFKIFTRLLSGEISEDFSMSVPTLG